MKNKPVCYLLKIAVMLLLTLRTMQGQDQAVLDSLNNVLKNTKGNDTTRALTLMALGDAYFMDEPVQAISSMKEALKIAEDNIAHSSGIEKDRYNEIIFTAYNNIGFVYKKHGNIKNAIDCYFKALKIAEELGNYEAISPVANNIGVMYRTSGDGEKSLPYYRKALDAALKSHNKSQEAQSYTNLGRYYLDKDTAITMNYYRKALAIHQQINNADGVGLLLNNIGFVYLNNKDYKTTLSYFKKSLEKKLEGTETIDIVMGYNNMGRVYLKLLKPDSAFYFYSMAENMQKKNKFPEEYGATLRGLYLTYKAKGNADKALSYLEEYKMYSDSLFNHSNKEELTKKDLQYDFEKKEALAKAEQEKKEELALAEQKKQRAILWSICGILILVVLFALYMFKSYRQKQKSNLELAEKNELINHQKELVEEKQKEIVDSINYALEIQKTLIANHDMVNQTIPDSFVFFQPKDIVSGDFYWATKKDKRFYLAVCDSTGHGVPGAFMSLLNINYLNEAIKEKNLVKPNEVFDHVRKRLIETISQNGRQDGMDGILICIEEGNNTITYAAANNAPILISQNNLLELGCNKMPVGIGEKTEAFTEFSFEVKKGDVLYLYTDGFADQFGGPAGKKFKYKQLKQLLLSNAHQSMEAQKAMMNSTFEKWRGTLEQVDDVCVIGIKL